MSPSMLTTRQELLREFVDRSKALSKQCIDTDDLDAALAILQASQLLEHAIDKLADDGQEEIPFPMPGAAKPNDPGLIDAAA